MKRLRRHLTPLATDTISPLNLPPVRMGLLTKLNVLTVGLIFLTALATTGYYLWQQWRHEEYELRTHGATVIRMLVELSEYGLYTNDRAYMDAILGSLDTESDIAYVVGGRCRAPVDHGAELRRLAARRGTPRAR